MDLVFDYREYPRFDLSACTSVLVTFIIVLLFQRVRYRNALSKSLAAVYLGKVGTG